MTSRERTELAKLQKEYNELHERFGYSRNERTCRELHERLGYSRNERTCRAINNRLDEICRKMDRLISGGKTNEQI